MRQGVDACDMGQIKCDLLDEKVLELFRGITADPALIQKFVKAEAPADVPDLKAAQARVSACERKIGRIVSSGRGFRCIKIYHRGNGTLGR